MFFVCLFEIGTVSFYFNTNIIFFSWFVEEVIAWIASVQNETTQGRPVVNIKSYKNFVNSASTSQFATNVGMTYSGAFLPLVERVLEKQHSTVYFKTVVILEGAIKEGVQMIELDKPYFQAKIPNHVFVLENLMCCASALARFRRKCFEFKIHVVFLRTTKDSFNLNNLATCV